jgi:poly(glycerol-phosphate) alpha-glucosyltransferase
MTASLSRGAGGLFESVRRLVQSLKEDGVDVCVLGTADKFTAEDIGLWSPVEAQAFSPNWPRKFGYSREYQLALQQYAPDLTHTHGIWLYPSVATNHYSRQRGIPYLISPHGMLDPWAVRHSRWDRPRGNAECRVRSAE